MLRFMFLLILALTLTACDRSDNVVRDEAAADPMTVQNDDITFSDLVKGQSIVLTPTEGPLVCMRFTGPWRFESWDPDLADWFGGDYADLTESNDPGTAGTLSFTWDPDNDPDEAELVARLTFTSEIGGAFAYNYAQGDVVHPTVEGGFEIIEGYIDAAECEGEQA